VAVQWSANSCFVLRLWGFYFFPPPPPSLFFFLTDGLAFLLAVA
jgi:hypothetical protein